MAEALLSYPQVRFDLFDSVSLALSGNLGREDHDAFDVSRLAQMPIKSGKRKTNTHN
jgi:hypothetical protein